MSAVTLAVLSALFARCCGNGRVLFHVVSSNRLTRELIKYPGYLAQVAPLMVDGIRGSVSELARRLSHDLIAACHQARYCPVEMSELRDAISHQRGVALGQDHLIFNFRDEVSTKPPDWRIDPSVNDLPSLREATSLSWTNNRVVRRDVRVFTDVVVGETLRLNFRINTEFVAPDTARAIALAFESALIELASADIDVERMARELSVPGPGGNSDHVVIDSSLASIGQSRAVIERVLGSSRVGLFVDNGQLVAHFHVNGRRPTLGEIHRRIMDALPGYPGAVGAHRYVLHEESPMDISSRGAWEALEIIELGDGRGGCVPDVPGICDECS